MLTALFLIGALVTLAGALWMLANAASSLTLSGPTSVGILGLAAAAVLGGCSVCGFTLTAAGTESVAAGTTVFLQHAPLIVACAVGALFSFSCGVLELKTRRARKDPGTPVDAIVVHGAALHGSEPSPFLKERLDCAITAWQRRNAEPAIVVSGGQGADEVASEAEVMGVYLAAHGVPRERILYEDRSTTTEENLALSLELIRSAKSTASPRMLLVSTDFHIPRCLILARRLGLNAAGIGASSTPLRYPRARIREMFAFAATLLHIK